MKRAIVLIGHGGVPKDYPRERLSRLRALESRRQAVGGAMDPEERTLDRDIRFWPRTPSNDPYQAGLEALAARLRPRLDGAPLIVAYNEFCAPSIEDAVESLVAAGVDDLLLLSAMMTPGGSHSEIEIPEAVDLLQRRFPDARIRYLWPYDLDALADFLQSQVARDASMTIPT
jgi:sirohydrochlorin cobaltochelatase